MYAAVSFLYHISKLQLLYINIINNNGNSYGIGSIEVLQMEWFITPGSLHTFMLVKPTRSIIKFRNDISVHQHVSKALSSYFTTAPHTATWIMSCRIPSSLQQQQVHDLLDDFECWYYRCWEKTLKKIDINLSLPNTFCYVSVAGVMSCPLINLTVPLGDKTDCGQLVLTD